MGESRRAQTQHAGNSDRTGPGGRAQGTGRQEQRPSELDEALLREQDIRDLQSAAQ